MSDIKVRAGDRIVIQATGRVSLGAFTSAAGPDGIRGRKNYNIVRDKGFRHGMLLARAKKPGVDTPWFAVGSQGEFISPINGYLEFVVNDRARRNNGGYFDAKMTVFPAE